MPDCIKQLTEAFGDIPPERIKEIVKALDELKGQDFASRSQAFRQKTVQELEMAAEFKANQIIARKRVEQFITTPEFQTNPNDVFKAKSFGVDHLSKGGNDSFFNTRNTIRDQHLRMLDEGVKDHMSVIADGKSDEMIANAIDRLNKNQNIQNLPEHVRVAANAIRNVNKSIIKTLQDVGVTIRERDDFISRQTHNREKIAQTPFKDWFAEIEPRLDESKTFPTTPDGPKRTEILRGIYEEIVAGDMENNVGHFGGKRVLHFKTGADWAQYNTKFGHGTLIDTAAMTINSASKVAATTRVLGPDARAIWDHMEKKVAEGMEPQRKAKFMDTSIGGEKRQRDNWSKEMFGYDRHPGREMVATFQRNVNLVTSGAKLGLSLPTTLTDLAFSANNFRAATGNRGLVEFDAMSKFFSVFTNKKELTYWANATDMYFGDLLADSFDRYGGFEGGGKNGFLQQFARKTISLSGLERQSASAKVANARLFSLELGKHSGKEWGDLNPRLRAGLERFNISEGEWKIVSSGTQEFKAGAIGITGEGIRNLPDSIISGAKRTDLAIKVSNYLGDMARVGSPEATGLERATITQGFSPEDPMGAFLRMAGQFKSFALAVPRVLRRISLSNPDAKGQTLLDNFRGQGDLSLLAATMTEATLLAGAAMVTKDVLKGKEPRELDQAFMVEAFVNGAAPLMVTYTMDALRGEYDKFGRSIFKDLAGPSIGQVDDVIRVLSGAVRMDSKAGIKATKFVMNNTPGMNLPFVKTTLNKLFLTDFFDYLNPGYEQRLRQRSKAQGTDFLFNPF